MESTTAGLTPTLTPTEDEGGDIIRDPTPPRFCAGYGGQPCQGPQCENFDCPYQIESESGTWRASDTENERMDEFDYYSATRHERGPRRYPDVSLADRNPQEKSRQGPSSD